MLKVVHGPFARNRLEIHARIHPGFAVRAADRRHHRVAHRAVDVIVFEGSRRLSAFAGPASGVPRQQTGNSERVGRSVGFQLRGGRGAAGHSWRYFGCRRLGCRRRGFRNRGARFVCGDCRDDEPNSHCQDHSCPDEPGDLTLAPTHPLPVPNLCNRGTGLQRAVESLVLRTGLWRIGLGRIGLWRIGF